MNAYFRMMHSAPSRVIRVFGGLWIVIAGAEAVPAIALSLAVLGAAVAVTGIADICPMELMVKRGS